MNADALLEGRRVVLGSVAATWSSAPFRGVEAALPKDAHREIRHTLKRYITRQLYCQIWALSLERGKEASLCGTQLSRQPMTTAQQALAGLTYPSSAEAVLQTQ